MRQAERRCWWLAYGAVFAAVLACATAARAQVPTANVARVFRPEAFGSAVSSNTLRSKDLSYISDAGAASAGSLPDAPQPQARAAVSGGYEPITGKERLTWILTQTLGPPDLAAGVLISAVGTAENKPREDGPHWGGFAERYGMRLTGIGTLSTMEAGFGAIWGEDPRYKREPERHLGGRLASVVEQTFMTRRRDGHFAPAYALFIAAPGSNFLSNTWRPDSEADAYHAGIRTIEAFGGIMASNAWDEFWPSVKDHLFHKH